MAFDNHDVGSRLNEISNGYILQPGIRFILQTYWTPEYKSVFFCFIVVTSVSLIHDSCTTKVVQYGIVRECMLPEKVYICRMDSLKSCSPQPSPDACHLLGKINSLRHSTKFFIDMSVGLRAHDRKSIHSVTPDSLCLWTWCHFLPDCPWLMLVDYNRVNGTVSYRKLSRWPNYQWGKLWPLAHRQIYFETWTNLTMAMFLTFDWIHYTAHGPKCNTSWVSSPLDMSLCRLSVWLPDP